MAITKDAVSPATGFTALNQAATSWTTASFSPPANSLVGVICSLVYAVSGSAPVPTVKDVNNVTYTAGPALYDTVFAWAGVFWHYYSSAPGSITITMTRTGTTATGVMVFPIVLDGAASSQAGAASNTNSSSSLSATSSITTTTAGSWVLVAAGIGSTESTITPSALTTTLQSFLDNTDGGVLAAGQATSATGTPGATTLGWTFSPTGTDWAWAALEILPAGGGSTTPSDAEAAHATETASLTASLSTPETSRATEAQSVTSPTPHDSDAVVATEATFGSPGGVTPRLYSVIRTYAR
jgi:hypothetical protein